MRKNKTYPLPSFTDVFFPIALMENNPKNIQSLIPVDMIKFIRIPCLVLTTCSFLALGCTSSSVLTFSSLSGSSKQRITELSPAESKKWGHLDPMLDTVPGMSVERAYKELIKKRKGQGVLVAIIDSGIDLDHEDLKGLFWENSGEIPGDGLDNDQNGFADDIHGYNFLGESYHEQLEFTRILARKIGDSTLQAQAKKELDSRLAETSASLAQLQQIEKMVALADQTLQKKLGKDFYSFKDLQKYNPVNEEEEQLIELLFQVYGTGQDVPTVLAELRGGVAYYQDQLDYNLNLDFNARTEVGDDPYILTEIGYGDGNPDIRDPEESHGTHVSGIVAANRKSKRGVNGVAQNVKIMSLRVVPDGDEYDKDVAHAIRYAADHGAKIINASFGKKFSPHASWVQEALAYAASKDVLFVHAAGNDGIDLDDPKNSNYPNDHYSKSGARPLDNYITVGALAPSYGPDMIASFSNYGKESVDIFAPGDEIYSTMPGNAYEFQGGTSMAAPAVAGLAAVLRSHFPELNATEVKQIILESGIPVPFAVRVGDKEYDLSDLCKSGKMANLYNAFLMAEKKVTGK